MKCKTVRRASGVAAVVLWLAAAGLTWWSAGDSRTNDILLLVSAAACFGVISAVGHLLAKGSAEKVWELGYEAGYQAAQKDLYDWPPKEGGKVTMMSTYRSS